MAPLNVIGEKLEAALNSASPALVEELQKAMIDYANKYYRSYEQLQKQRFPNIVLEAIFSAHS